MSDNDNDAEDPELSAIMSEVHMVGDAAMLGTLVERKLTTLWLRQTAAQILFADADMEPEIREYGTTVLEMVADAIDELEHWQNASISKETLQ